MIKRIFKVVLILYLFMVVYTIFFGEAEVPKELIGIDLLVDSFSIGFYTFNPSFIIGYSHDVFIRISGSPDRKYIFYCMNSLKHYKDLKSNSGVEGLICTRWHLYSALYGITNQFAGYNYADWLRWYKENRKKSRIDWFEEGYIKQGYIKNDSSDEEVIKGVLKSVYREETIFTVHMSKPLFANNAYYFLEKKGLINNTFDFILDYKGKDKQMIFSMLVFLKIASINKKGQGIYKKILNYHRENTFNDGQNDIWNRKFHDYYW